MKISKTLSILFLFLCVSISLEAQTPYIDGMKKGFQLWEEGKTTESVALFERIGQAENENWLPVYYAANVLISSSFGTPEEATRNEMLEKAKVYIKQAHERSPKNSEIYTLEGLLYTAYVAMDPGTYAMQYSQKIMELHTKAIELDPKNPRALANAVEYEMGTARFFNQDLAPFAKRLKEIIPIFENQELSEPFAPSWGKDRVLQVLKEITPEEKAEEKGDELKED